MSIYDPPYAPWFDDLRDWKLDEPLPSEEKTIEEEDETINTDTNDHTTRL